MQFNVGSVVRFNIGAVSDRCPIGVRSVSDRRLISDRRDVIIVMRNGLNHSSILSESESITVNTRRYTTESI